MDTEKQIAKVCKNLGIKSSEAHKLICPALGSTFTLGDVVYKVEYVRSNPCRFSAVPIGVLKPEKEREESKEATSGQSA